MPTPTLLQKTTYLKKFIIFKMKKHIILWANQRDVGLRHILPGR